ncbi:MAG TPA: sugar phosphate isomerase, partial [Methanomethylovorans sp.]|nr:sugar phosphate isomerase [Methanomethylovorans sp.]
MNFSLHESDLSRFENDWNNIESFLRTHGLDGVELFVDHTPLPDFPCGIVEGVHLPYWMGRHRAWVDENAFHEDMDENEKFFLFGGHDRQDMIANFINALKNAASVNAEY